MLQWKSAWSICPQCRLRMLAAASSRRTLGSRNITTSTRSMKSTRLQAHTWTSIASRRDFTTSLSRYNRPNETVQGAGLQDDLPPPSADVRGEVHEPGDDGGTLEGEESLNVQHENDGAELEALEPSGVRAPPEDMARAARNFFGDSLPQGALTNDEFVIYKRMYGEPSSLTVDHLAQAADETGDILMRDNEDGTVDEFEYVQEPEEDQIVDEDADLEDEEEGIEVDGVQDNDALLRQQVGDLSLVGSLEQETEMALTFGDMAEDAAESGKSNHEVLDEIYDNWPGDEYVRTHPLTKEGRFGTHPSTIQLPREALVTPVQQMLSNVSNKHISEAAQKLLGGVGIPDSPSTPAVGRSKGQRPIPLTAFQSKMSPMDANVFVTSIMPQVYASAVSTLVECRKRLGSQWLKNLMKKEGGPMVLDAGAGGAGIVAFKEIMRAEWESLRENQEDVAGQKDVPIARSTVVAGSDSLRVKASTLLENTTFIPRLPEYVDPTQTESNVQQPRKRYDVIIASHALWTLVEEHDRKSRTQTLWSLLNPKGGVLILLEKGVPRGFEVIAGARELLLDKHISSPEDASPLAPTAEQEGRKNERYSVKEKGAIIAPCTNHTKCPLYPTPGIAQGRKDWCYFQQRYTRPSYLMSVLQAKARNHDDVEFSYLAVQRGVDLRRPADDGLLNSGFIQGEEATERAKRGYGKGELDAEEPDINETAASQAESKETEPASDEAEAVQPHPLSLPRILPNPLKRKGHILIDVCTPSGTYERWMVRRGLGSQAFRDARKAKWGDLWALGASSSETRRLKLGTPVQVVNMADKRAKQRRKGWRKGRDGGKGKWRFDGVEEQV